jgi:hypothetical protein
VRTLVAGAAAPLPNKAAGKPLPKKSARKQPGGRT